MDENKIECKTPTPGKKPTRIQKWKYDMIANAILAILAHKGDGVLFKELPHLVADRIDNKVKNTIGSISWYTTTVKLDLECKNKIARISGSKPQRLIKL